MSPARGPGRVVKAGVVLAMAAAAWATVVGLVFAIVTDHGRLPAACAASAIAGFATATFIVSWRVGHELRVEQAQNVRYHAADTRYELDALGPLAPHEPRHANQGQWT